MTRSCPGSCLEARVLPLLAARPLLLSCDSARGRCAAGNRPRFTRAAGGPDNRPGPPREAPGFFSSAVPGRGAADPRGDPTGLGERAGQDAEDVPIGQLGCPGPPDKRPIDLMPRRPTSRTTLTLEVIGWR